MLAFWGNDDKTGVSLAFLGKEVGSPTWVSFGILVLEFLPHVKVDILLQKLYHNVRPIKSLRIW